jgi:hypothetical protein
LFQSTGCGAFSTTTGAGSVVESFLQENKPVNNSPAKDKIRSDLVFIFVKNLLINGF